MPRTRGVPKAKKGCGLKGLPIRQHQVIMLRLKHWQPKEIGDALGLSTKTVNAHIARAFVKLECTCMREVATRFTEILLIDAEEANAAHV